MTNGALPDRLPSLNAIRTFEAVGRLLSYAGAAQELHVTTSAVSHQIRALEAYLGVPLLHRQRQRVSLTSAGANYFQQCSRALTQLSMATSGLLRAKGARIVRLSGAPSIVSCWLIPKLERFQAAFPDIALEVLASTDRVDFALGEFDIAIEYTRRVESGLHATALGKNEVFPVCSPLLMEGRFPLRTPADFQRYVLIDSRDIFDHGDGVATWAGWLRASGNPHITGLRHLHLSPRYLVLQTVAQGVGVGLARTLMAAEGIKSKQVVCPFGPALPLTANYYLTCPEATANKPEIVAFREWLLAEARASQKAVKIPAAA